MPIAFRLVHLWRIFIKTLGFASFGIGTLVLTVVVFPFIRLTNRNLANRDRRMRKAVKRSFAMLVGFLNAARTIRVQWQGKTADLLNSRGRILIANHPSLLDIVIIMAKVPNADCIVKSRLFQYPLVRSVVGSLFISNAVQGEALIRTCGDSLSAGHNLIIFPEGTRSDSEKLKGLKRGAARIALATGCDTIPVCIHSEDATGLRKGDRFFSFKKDGPIRYNLEVKDTVVTARFKDSPPAIAARRLTTEYNEAISS